MITKVLKPIGTWLIKGKYENNHKVNQEINQASSTDEITIVCFGKFSLRKRSHVKQWKHPHIGSLRKEAPKKSWPKAILLHSVVSHHQISRNEQRQGT